MQSYNFVENIELCRTIVDDAAQLLYYSHIPTAGAALLIGFYVLYKNRSDLTSRLLFIISLLFSIWSTLDLFVWLKFDNSGLLMFFWSLYGIFFTTLYIASFYFVYVFINKHDTSVGLKTIFLFTLIPLLTLLTTNLNVSHHHASDCVGVDNLIHQNYYLFLSLLYALSIVFYIAKKWQSIPAFERKMTLLLGVGIEAFLLVFFATVWGVGYLIDSGYIKYSNYDLEQYGLFGMPIFMAFLAYVTVKYKMFNVKLIATQVLVVGLLFLIGAQLFFVKTTTNFILVGVTLLLGFVGSYFLIQSVKREIKQREKIEQLAQDLARANDRLRELDKAKSEFVSIASHQLRSPLTSIRGYASMLVEGSFGKLPTKALEASARIEESAKLMVLSVEDYLNVSRIESGNMKYNLSDFDVKEMTEHICDDMRPEAMKKGLVLLFRSDLKGQGIVNADIGKTNQIIQNLLNNSLKYTPKGSINVFVRDDLKSKRIYVSITDTGIGMSEKTADSLFQKFSRADNANSVNVSGTGLGLYVALKMAEQMGGTISCESEGDGKGSTFTFELPLGL